jgi:hypothetical protein
MRAGLSRVEMRLPRARLAQTFSAAAQWQQMRAKDIMLSGPDHKRTAVLVLAKQIPGHSPRCPG